VLAARSHFKARLDANSAVRRLRANRGEGRRLSTPELCGVAGAGAEEAQLQASHVGGGGVAADVELLQAAMLAGGRSFCAHGLRGCARRVRWRSSGLRSSELCCCRLRHTSDNCQCHTPLSSYAYGPQLDGELSRRRTMSCSRRSRTLATLPWPFTAGRTAPRCGTQLQVDWLWQASHHAMR